MINVFFKRDNFLVCYIWSVPIDQANLLMWLQPWLRDYFQKKIADHHLSLKEHNFHLNKNVWLIFILNDVKYINFLDQLHKYLLILVLRCTIEKLKCEDFYFWHRLMAPDIEITSLCESMNDNILTGTDGVIDYILGLYGFACHVKKINCWKLHIFNKST